MKRVVLLSLLLVAACKSGQGDRCQVNDDCANGLVCNKAKNTCQGSTGGDLDAAVQLPDAGPPADAPPDTN